MQSLQAIERHFVWHFLPTTSVKACDGVRARTAMHPSPGGL